HLAGRNAEMLGFVQAPVAFPRSQPNVRRWTFLTGKAAGPGMLPDVSWYGPDGKPTDWHSHSPSLTSVFGTSGLDDPNARPVMVMLHAGRGRHHFNVPPAVANLNWRLFVDTAAESPADLHPKADGPP